MSYLAKLIPGSRSIEMNGLVFILPVNVSGSTLSRTNMGFKPLPSITSGSGYPVCLSAGIACSWNVQPVALSVCIDISFHLQWLIWTSFVSSLSNTMVKRTTHVFRRDESGHGVPLQITLQETKNGVSVSTVSKRWKNAPAVWGRFRWNKLVARGRAATTGKKSNKHCGLQLAQYFCTHFRNSANNQMFCSELGWMLIVNISVNPWHSPNRHQELFA